MQAKGRSQGIELESKHSRPEPASNAQPKNADEPDSQQLQDGPRTGRVGKDESRVGKCNFKGETCWQVATFESQQDAQGRPEIAKTRL